MAREYVEYRPIAVGAPRRMVTCTECGSFLMRDAIAHHDGFHTRIDELSRSVAGGEDIHAIRFALLGFTPADDPDITTLDLALRAEGDRQVLLHAVDLFRRLRPLVRWTSGLVALRLMRDEVDDILMKYPEDEEDSK